MPARTVEIAFLGSTAQLERQLERAGLVAHQSGSTIGDAFTKGTDKAGGAVSKLGQLGASLGVPFSSSLTTIGKHLDEATTKTARLHTALSEAGKVTLLAGGAGLAAAGVEAVKLGAAYETAQASIRGATGQSVKSTESLTGAFEKLGLRAAGSGQEMEGAYATVAGQLKLTEGHILSTAEAAKFGSAANDLSEASASGLASAYSALAQTMQAFHLQASQAGQASDTLYNVSKSLHLPVEQVGTSMARLHSRLGEAAPSMKDIAGLMDSLGSRGVQGSRGLQVVNTAFQTLVGGGKKTTETLDNLGVHVFNQQGQFVGLQNVISQLQPKLAGLTQQQRFFAEQTLFGKGAAQVMGQVVEAGVPAFQRATDAATRMGSAHKAAELQANTLHGELEAVKHTVETLGGALGLALIPEVKAAGKALEDGTHWLERHKTAAEALGVVITGVLGTAVAVFAYDKAVAFGKGIASMVGDMRKLGSVVLGETGKMRTAFAEQSGAAEASAEKVGTATSASAGAVEAEAGKIGTSSQAVEGSFAGQATAAGTAATNMGAAETKMVSETGAADAKIEASNAKAGESFGAAAGGLLGGLGSLLTSAGAVALGAVGGQIGESLGNAGENPLVRKSKEAVAREKRELGIINEPGARANHMGTRPESINTIAGAAAKYGISPSVLYGVYGNETSYGKDVTTSKAGAKGAFQFIEETAKAYKYPYTNKETPQIFKAQAEAAAHYLSDLIKQHHGNVSAALEQYSGQMPGYAQHAQANAGSAAIQQQLEEASGAKPKKHKAKKPTGEDAFVDPFSAAHHLRRGREDMGIDYTMDVGSAIEAMGTGKVTELHPWGGSAGNQPYLEYEITKGSHKGLKEYIAEQINPLVHAGQAIKAGQTIATYAAHGTGLETGIGAGGGVTLAQSRHEFTDHAGNDPTSASKQMAKLLSSAGKAGSESAIATEQFTNQLKTQAEAVKKASEALKARGSSEIQHLQGASSLSVSQLQNLLGARTTGGQAASAPAKQYDALLASLKAAGDKSLVTQLVAAHKSAMVTLASDVSQIQHEAATQILQNQASEAEKQLAVVKDQATEQTNAMQGAATQIDDMTSVVRSQMEAAATALTDSMQTTGDTSSGEVQAIKDRSKIEVDTLAERGLYGLNLLAQKEQVGLDQMTASYDVQINQAQLDLDNVKASQDQVVAQDKTNVALLQAHEDARVAQAQAHADAVQASGNVQIAAADAQSDSAKLASIIAAGGSKAQQNLAKNYLAESEAHVSAVSASANAAIQAATGAFAATQAEAQLAIAQANLAIANAEAAAKQSIGVAEQALQQIKDTAEREEASAEALVAKTKEESSTQYAGSGTVINVTGVPITDAAAIASEVGWVMRSQAVHP